MAINTKNMPQANLQPGQSGQDVTALQQWLIASGYSIPSGPTGYYGDQTKTAVAKLQKDLGVNTAGNDGFYGPATRTAVNSGGSSLSVNSDGSLNPPRNPTSGATTAAPSTSSTAKAAAPGGTQANTQGAAQYSTQIGAGQWRNPDGTVTSSPYFPAPGTRVTDDASGQSFVSDGSVRFDTTKGRFINVKDGSQAVIENGSLISQGTPATGAGGTGASGSTASSSIGAYQLGIISAIVNGATTLYGSTGNQISFEDALNYAKSDPLIQAKYSDALALDKNAFKQSLETLQQSTASENTQRKLLFEQDRKNLAEQSAGAGQAYSGFRNKAQENLSSYEEAVISSSRAQKQDALNRSTAAFESKWGTGATTPGSLQFTDPMKSLGISASGLFTGGAQDQTETLTGSMAGKPITGTSVLSQKDEELAKAAEAVNLGKYPGSNF